MKLTYHASHKFVKSWSKLNQKSKEKSVKKIDLFLENPHSPNLKTHKLSGKLDGYWSFSIEHNLRIMFKFKSDKEVDFIDIGTHSIYK